MPKNMDDAWAEAGRMHRSEKDWILEEVTAFDGLSPSQLVRTMDQGPTGLEPNEAARLPEKTDGAADANAGSWNPVGTDRYVCNPVVGRTQLEGLWTGGPVRFARDFDNPSGKYHWRLVQTLTKTWCAGHGYSVDDSGRYAFSATGTAAKAALKAHRPELKRIFSSRMAFDGSIPGTYRTEIKWRDFTHESIGPLEALSVADIQECVAAHGLGAGAIQAIESAHCEIDANTNTVVFTAVGLATAAGEPEDVEDLFDLPHYEAPCEKELLRGWGLGSAVAGEGWKYTHAFVWPALQDTAATRHVIEFATDEELIEESGLDPDEYKVEDQKVDRDEDGLLTYRVVFGRREWHGEDGDPEKVEGRNPLGLAGTVRTLPSVNTCDAEATMAAQTAPNGEVLTGISRTEGPDGRSDITIESRKTFDYDTTSPAAGVPSTGGVAAPTVRAAESARKRAWHAEFPGVAQADVEDVETLAEERIEAAGGAKVTVTHEMGPDGLFTVSIDGEDATEAEVAEWLSEITHFVEIRRNLKYNVAEDDLTDGSLDSTTHERTIEERQLNDNGTYDETIRKEKPVARSWTYTTTETNGGLSREVVHVQYRNQSIGTIAAAMGEVETGYFMEGSISENEFGLEDGETRTGPKWSSLEEERKSDTHYVLTEGSRKDYDESQMSQAGIHDVIDPEDPQEVIGKTITTVRETDNGDGTFNSDIENRTSHARDWTYTTTETNGKLSRTVRHHVYRNQVIGTIATAMSGVHSGYFMEGSIVQNEFGLEDGETRTGPKWENVEEKRKTDDHYTEDVGSRKDYNASQYSRAGISRNVITTVNETVNGDGTFTADVRKETPHAQDWEYTTRETNGGKVRTVTHHVYRNQAIGTIATALSAVTAGYFMDGSVVENRFGLEDGETRTGPKWENVEEKNKVDTHYTLTEGSRKDYDSSQYSRAGLANNVITSVQETANGDGTFRADVQARTPHAQDWGYSYVERSPNGDRERTVTVFEYRNQAIGTIAAALAAKADEGADTDSWSGSVVENDFALEDGRIVQTTKWGNAAGSGYHGWTQNDVIGPYVTKQVQTRVNALGVEEYREVQIEATDYIGTYTKSEIKTKVAGGWQGTGYGTVVLEKGGDRKTGTMIHKVTGIKYGYWSTSNPANFSQGS